MSAFCNLHLPSGDLSPPYSLLYLYVPTSIFPSISMSNQKRMDSPLFVLTALFASLFSSCHPAENNPHLHVMLICYQGHVSHILLPFSVVCMCHCTPLHMLNTTYSHQSVWPHHDVGGKMHPKHRDVCSNSWPWGIVMSVPYRFVIARYRNIFPNQVLIIFPPPNAFHWST